MYCREKDRSGKINPHTLQQELCAHPGPPEILVETSVAVQLCWYMVGNRDQSVLYGLTCGVFRLGCRNCSMGFHQLLKCVHITNSLNT